MVTGNLISRATKNTVNLTIQAISCSLSTKKYLFNRRNKRCL